MKTTICNDKLTVYYLKSQALSKLIYQLVLLSNDIN